MKDSRNSEKAWRVYSNKGPVINYAEGGVGNGGLHKRKIDGPIIPPPLPFKTGKSTPIKDGYFLRPPF